jgi:AmpE protein
LGILGAVAYRLIDRLAAKRNPNSMASMILPYLDWIPARITALFYLLVGNFQQVFPYLLRNVLSPVQKNEEFLTESGMLALKQDGKEPVTLSLAEQLVWYALILLLVITALLTLARWL